MITTQINGRKASNFRRVGWIGFESLDSISLDDYKNTFIDLGSEFSNLIPSIEYQFVGFGGFCFYSLDGGQIYSPNYNSSGRRFLFTPVITHDDTMHTQSRWTFYYDWLESIPSSGTFTLYPRFGAKKGDGDDEVYAVTIRCIVDGFKDFKYITVPYDMMGDHVEKIEGIIKNGSNIKIGTTFGPDSFDHYMLKPRYRGIKFYECTTEQVSEKPYANNTAAMNLNWDSYTLTKKGNLVASLIPIALSDGTAGLYNEATGKFYGTNGPGRVLFGN